MASFWVLRYLVKIFFIIESGSRFLALHAASTIRHPPQGLTIRFKGLSVCSPTINSCSLSIYPGPHAVIPATRFVSTSKTPLVFLSSFISFWHLLHNSLVREEGPDKKSDPSQ